MATKANNAGSGATATGDWLPIESAPKDGTQILIAGGFFDDDTSMDSGMKMTGVAIVSWAGSWGEKGWQGEQRAHDEYFWHQPTHWMPLPAPPGASK